MKLISWNVNGLRACVQKGFLEYFQQVDADVFCIQESKLQEGQIDLDLPGYHQYWNYAVKKGYSGTGTEENIRCQCQRLISSNILKRCFIPYYQQKKRFQGKWHIQERILFPGYVFLIARIIAEVRL